MKTSILIAMVFAGCIEQGLVGEDEMGTGTTFFTPEDAHDFAWWMADRYDFAIREAHFGEYSRAIGDRVYLNFEPGEAGRTPWSQIKNVIHESGHVVQWRTNEHHSWRYATDPTYRASMEAECWTREMIADWHIQARINGAHKYAKRLTGAYQCEQSEVDYAEEILEENREDIMDGHIVDNDMSGVLVWLFERG